MHVELHLPFPPSDNHYYSKAKNGTFISHKGRKFRDEVAEAVREQYPLKAPIDYRVLLEITYHMPDKRIRDILNYNKATMDALTRSGVWEDDQLIDQAIVYRGVNCFSGKTIVLIHEAGPLQPIAKPYSILA